MASTADLPVFMLYLKQQQQQKKHIFAVFDQLDVISYEEVVQLPAFKRKTLVLIGKHRTVL